MLAEEEEGNVSMAQAGAQVGAEEVVDETEATATSEEEKESKNVEEANKYEMVEVDSALAAAKK